MRRTKFSQIFAIDFTHSRFIDSASYVVLSGGTTRLMYPSGCSLDPYFALQAHPIANPHLLMFWYIKYILKKWRKRRKAKMVLRFQCLVPWLDKQGSGKTHLKKRYWHPPLWSLSSFGTMGFLLVMTQLPYIHLPPLPHNSTDSMMFMLLLHTEKRYWW